MVYQFFVFYLLAVAFLCAFTKNVLGGTALGGKRIYLALVFIALFLIMGLRSTTVGVDTFHYSLIYKAISNMTFTDIFRGKSHFEVGFALLMKISSMIIDDYYFYQLISSLLFCFLFYRFIRENNSAFFTASILFIAIVYLTAFNISRQMLAVAFVASAWNSLKNKQYKLFVSFFLLAFSFHTSAIVAVFIYLIYFYRNNRKIVCLLSILVLIFPYIFHATIPFLERYFTAYESYYSNTREIQEANLVKILWGIEAFLALFILLHGRRFDSEKQFIALMCLIFVMTNVIALSFNYFERVGLYFSPFLILLFEVFGDDLKRRTMRQLYYAGVNTCFLLFFLRASSVEQYVYSSFL